MNRLYEVNLAAPKFEVSPFQAVEFKPEATSYNLLSDSIDKLKEERVQARKNYDDVITLFGNTTKQLYMDDPETLKWWSDYQDSIKYDLDSYMNSGDYVGTVMEASKMAAKVAQDPELQGRINSGSKYKGVHDEYLKKVNDGKGTILDTSLEWWEEQDPYHHENMLDKDGNIIGGTWKQKVFLFDEINWANLYNAAGQMYHPDTNSTSTSKESNKSRGSEKGSKSSGSSSSSAHSLTVVTPQQINRLAQELASDTTTSPMVSQQYEKDKFRYAKLKQKRDAETDEAKKKDLNYEINKLKTKLFDKNGNTDLVGYVTRCLSNEVFSEAIAHREESRSSHKGSNSSITHYDPKSGGSGSRGGGSSTSPVVVNVNNGGGSNYQQQPTYSYPGPRLEQENRTILGKVGDAISNLITGGN